MLVISQCEHLKEFKISMARLFICVRIFFGVIRIG